MKVLIAPMSAMAQTNGCMTRAIAICHELLSNGHDVAFCAAEDMNYKTVTDVKNYYAPVPSPLGLPLVLGKRAFKVAKTLGIQQRKSVNSFEEVLQLTGANNRKYFEQDLLCLQKAIQDFQPDIIYSEFRLTAIVAAKLEGVTVAGSISYPTQTSYACNSKYSGEVRRFLQNKGLPQISSILDVFRWMDIKFVPSSYELEPFSDEKVVFTGAFFKPGEVEICKHPNIIVVYMGNGAITTKKVVKELISAFHNSSYNIYIASSDLTSRNFDNITIDKYFDFADLMPKAVAYINHGGQNSIMTGLMYGVPQIICAGKVFERKYNAESIVRLNAGVSLQMKEFTSKTLRSAVQTFENNNKYKANALRAGKTIETLGGAKTVVEVLQKHLI